MKKPNKESSSRQKRASICIDSKSNTEWYCSKHNNWSGRINYIWLGIKYPYEYKITKSVKNDKKSQKKSKELLAKRYKID